jgi:hypothetical protein
MTNPAELFPARERLPGMKMTIASPCQASWEKMIGDERARFCQKCRLHVYNLSGMTEPEARQLLEEREGKVCVRFYQRSDGTVMTKNCPVRFRTFRRRLAIALGSLLAACGAVLAVRQAADDHRLSFRPLEKLLQWIHPEDVRPVMGEPMMGTPPPPPRPPQ